jgi:hypothetical protein
MREFEWIANELFCQGLQYYVVGRFGHFAQLIGVTGNIYHHAIEYLLKAHLLKSPTGFRRWLSKREAEGAKDIRFEDVSLNVKGQPRPGILDAREHGAQ